MYNFSNIITELSNYDKRMIDLHLCGSDVHYGDYNVFYSHGVFDVVCYCNGGVIWK